MQFPSEGIHPTLKIELVRPCAVRRSAHRSAKDGARRPFAARNARPLSKTPKILHFHVALFVRRATASEGFARPVLALGHHKGCRRRLRAAWAAPRWRRNSDELAFEASMIRASSTASAVAARPTRR